MHTIIIGGGITGLSAAYYLKKYAPDVEVTLLESSHRLGGKILTERIGGFLVEGSADSFLSRKPAGMALVNELGMQIQGRIPENRATFVKRHGKLHPLPEGLTGLIPTNLDALTNSTLLSADGVERVRNERAVPPRMDDSEETIAQFITRRMGQEAYENLIEPLMGGIYGGRADLLSVDAIFAPLVALERRAGSLLKGFENRPAAPNADTPPFVSFANGMGELIGRLSTVVDAEIYLDAPVTSLEKVPTGFRVASAVGDFSADHIIATTPAYVTAQLVSPFDRTLSDLLHEIPYSSAAIVTLAFAKDDLPQPLNGYGYVIPRVEGQEVLACTWSSSKWARRAPVEQVLLRVYLGRYGIDVTAYPDEKLVAMARQEVLEGVGISAEPQLQTIHRWSNSIPQYTLGHRARIGRIQHRASQQRGLLLAGSYFDGVGIPDCIRHGEQAARKIVDGAN